MNQYSSPRDMGTPADKAQRAADRKTQLQRRWDAAQRCEPLAHRRGDDRGFYTERVA